MKRGCTGTILKQSGIVAVSGKIVTTTKTSTSELIKCEGVDLFSILSYFEKIE
jgi:hypothetical protein